MNTTKQKKDDFINAGSEIKNQLLEIFGTSEQLTIADIGACEGLSTIIYSRLFPNAEFVCFEPIKSNFEKMKENFKEYGIEDRIKSAVPGAIGDKNRRVTMWKSQGEAPGVVDWDTGNKSSSLLRPKDHLREHKWCKFRREEEVEVWTLDHLADLLNFRVDFAHIDVQGAEMMVLKGGEKTFSNTRAIWLEVANIELYAHQPLKRDLAKYLSNKGFSCELDTCGGKYGDQLWVKK